LCGLHLQMEAQLFIQLGLLAAAQHERAHALDEV
jgi:hypothetical protein